MTRIVLVMLVLAATLNGGERSFATDNEPCVRGEPVAWLEGKVPKDMHAFRLINATTALETFVRDDGANLTIEHGGCETYAATIRFVAPRSSREHDAVLEVIAALRELQRLEAGGSFDFKLAELELRKRDLPELLASHEEIAVSGDGEDFLQTRIVLQRAGWIEDAAFVEFLMVKGPL